MQNSTNLASARAREARSSLRILALAAAMSVAWGLLTPSPAHAAGPFTFSGSGWGHSIGMSQWGARGLAEQGRSAQEILGHYYSGTGVGGYPMPGHVRVGLLWNRFDPIEVSGTRNMEFRSGSFSVTVPAGQTWAVHATGDGRFLITRSDGSHAGVVGSTSSPLQLVFAGSILRLPDTGHQYRHGTLEFNVYATSSHVLRAVLSLGIEHYLYGLGEMPSSWPTEALRAQAVAGRTYAVEKINRLGQNRPTCNCGVFATTLDQAYVGYDKEVAGFGGAWTGAVDATAGQVSLHNGAPIQAYYFSSDGGSTENNEDIWGGSGLPYLRARYDIWSRHPNNPNSLWTVTFSDGDLASRLGLASVSGVDLSDRTAGGGVRTALVFGHDGSNPVARSFSGDDFRRRLSLRSTFVNIHQYSEFLLLMNPSDQTADVNLTLMTPEGTSSNASRQVAPRSRKTIPVDDLISGEVSLKVDSNIPIGAERAMYFYQAGVDDGHDTRGMVAPSHQWFFAEGATHGGFSEFILLNNPSTTQTSIVTIAYQTPGGQTSTQQVEVAPGRRRTISVDEAIPSDDVAVSVTAAGAPIVAERAMYFAVQDHLGYPLVDGGTVSEGATSASERWYLPEGATHSGFSTFILVQNPNPTSVQVALDLQTPAGLAKTVVRDMAPTSRLTVSLNAELPGEDVSTVVRSMSAGKPVIAERAVYFVNGLFDGGTAALGSPQTSPTWYLPEGATHSGLTTFVLVQNPNAEVVDVALDLLNPGGLAKTVVRTMAPGSRLTVSLNAELPEQDVSTVVRSLTGGLGVVAERAVYFDGRGFDGGHDSLGVPGLSTTWYFAEGFTG